MTAPDDLASWLLAQIDEDERKVRDAAGQHVAWTADLMPSVLNAVTRHARRDLLDCQAKRRIIELHDEDTQTVIGSQDVERLGTCGVCCEPSKWDYFEWVSSEFPCDTLRMLALPYADRPGYQERWRP